MNNTIPNVNYDSTRNCCINWGAIFAGALVALGLGFLLQLFGLAIGLSAYHASTSGGASTLAIGGYLGILIGVIASMMIAGFVAGHHGRFDHYHPHESFVYGFVTWCLALLLSAVLVMPMARYVAAYSEMVGPRVVVSSQLPQHVMLNKNADNGSATPEKADVGVTPTALTGGFWLLFLLFFIGAFSSCVGAYYGMRCRYKHCVQQMNTTL